MKRSVLRTLSRLAFTLIILGSAAAAHAVPMRVDAWGTIFESEERLDGTQVFDELVGQTVHATWFYDSKLSGISRTGDCAVDSECGFGGDPGPGFIFSVFRIGERRFVEPISIEESTDILVFSEECGEVECFFIEDNRERLTPEGTGTYNQLAITDPSDFLAGVGPVQRFDFRPAASGPSSRNRGTFEIFDLEGNVTYIRYDVDRVRMFPIPEPPVLALVGLGLFAAVLIRRRENRLVSDNSSEDSE